MKCIDIIIQMEEMIFLQNTGTAEEFAQKLGISLRSLYNYLGELKELGAPIAYCRHRRTYYYERKGRILVCFCEIEIVQKNKVMNL